MARPITAQTRARFAPHGWLGLLLVAIFWPLNWLWPGPRTHWAFFPLWLGYAFTVDALVLARRGTSLLHRGPLAYAGLFVLSVPLWWLFEAFNLRTRNWHYLGGEAFTALEYAFFASLSFSTVVPAVLGTAELVATLPWMERLARGPRLAPTPRVRAGMTAAGGLMLLLLLCWPRIFYPCLWLALVCLLEPWNAARGWGSLFRWTARGDWRPVGSLALGTMICGFFWEMWNIASWPKWVYDVPFFGFLHVFEMPLLGYLGYLPFGLEVFAFVHFAYGLLRLGRSDYVAAAFASTELAPGGGASSRASAAGDNSRP